MANFDVRRILVDQISSLDIMYTQLYSTLQLDETHLTPYVCSCLQGFKGAVAKPWGFVKLPRSGVRIILENGEGIMVKVSLELIFPTSNNQAEYEAFLASLRLAKDLGGE